ncbi:hypothetical protein DRO54_06500 [Candidatus Bathyarchaeota archaeon]|nr:MAG: hypothetical protein DRO54_06500 [Candidatus Bathyarchaeota archaeon]
MVVNQSDVITRPIKPFFIGKAVVASLWKSGFMGDTFVRGRRQFEKYKSSFMGDLAKLALKEWLEEQGFEVIDYDDVRSSWRSSRKPYDLQVNNHNIEVKSSVAQRPNLQWILQNEHIIHPCNVTVKEITVQTFFKDASCEMVWLCGWALRSDLEQPRYRQPRRVPGGRLTDFYLMPFSDPNAKPMNDLLSYL